MNTQNQQKKGFTIIEVVLVLAIAGLIFLIVFLAVPALQRSQRDTQRRNDVGRFMSQITQYQSNNGGKVPSSSGDLTDFRDRYLVVGGDTFADPTSGTVYTLDYNNNGSGFDSDKQEMLSANPGTGKLYYYKNAVCDGENVESTSGDRKIAVATKLEGGAIYCQDNT